MKKLMAALFVLLLLLIAAVSCFAQGITEEDGSTYQSEDFMYTLTVPEEVYIQKGENPYPDILLLGHNANRFSARISCDLVDEAMIKNMREYIDDFQSDDPSIFNALVQLKTSQFTALQQHYKEKFQFPDLTTGNESNMKVFARSTETLFGTASHVILYNTIEYNDSEVNEQTFINIIIPSFSNRIIYSLNFMMPRGNLDAETSAAIFKLLRSLHISNLQEQSEEPLLLRNQAAIKAANEGIYPSLESSNIKYDFYTNKTMGFKIKYPATFIPYIQNNFISSMQYNSFKIDSKTSFSILSEKIQADTNVIQNKINTLLYTGGNNLTITDVGISDLNTRKAVYIKYVENRDGVTIHTLSYFIRNNATFYTIKLESRLSPPSSRVLEEFHKICNSMEFIAPAAQQVIVNTYMNRFNHKEKNYEFSYPSNWNLTKESVSNQVYDIYTLKNPDFSSPLTIAIFDDALKTEIGYKDISKLPTLWFEDFKSYFSSGFLPYENYVARPIAGSYFTEDNVSCITRLVNYLDDNDRSRYGYSISFIKDQKIYTMFISLSEYALADGRTIESNLGPIINRIAESFALKN